MKKVFICLVLVIMLLTITGCSDDASNDKNIFHSAWDSSNGYELIINDPEKNSKISTPSCWINNGEKDIGLCYVEFSKDYGFLKIIWSFDAGDKTDSVIIYENTNSFVLNGYTFTWGANLK